jgi:hypothetical protein
VKVHAERCMIQLAAVVIDGDMHTLSCGNRVVAGAGALLGSGIVNNSLSVFITLVRIGENFRVGFKIRIENKIIHGICSEN